MPSLIRDLFSAPIPGLFVVVSWISFVVPPDVIPGRMALLITLFLVLVNIFNSVTTNTPKAEGENVCGCGATNIVVCRNSDIP